MVKLPFLNPPTPRPPALYSPSLARAGSCSLGTGFTGTFEEVAAHEQRVLAARRQEALYGGGGMMMYPPMPGWGSLPGSVQYPNSTPNSIQVLNTGQGSIQVLNNGPGMMPPAPYGGAFAPAPGMGFGGWGGY